MNKFIKHGWWTLLLIPLIFAFGVYVNNNYIFNGISYKTTNEKEKESARKNELVEIIEAEIPEYVTHSTCSVSSIDWDIAVTALSQHFINLAKIAKRNRDTDFYFGPAETERHFTENCEEDLKIYNEYVLKLKNHK